MSRRLCMASLLLACVAMPVQAYATPCDGVVTTIEGGAATSLDEVLTRVRHTSPDILSAALETRARGADAAQAGRWRNPSVSLEVENFAGSGGFSGFGGADATLSIEQTLRLGNKRKLEQRAARSRALLGAAECEVMVRDVELDAALLYAELVASQAAEMLTGQAAMLGQDLAEVSRKRVDAGEAAPPDLARARADAAKLKADAAEAAARVDDVRNALAAIWGQTGEDIELSSAGLQMEAPVDPAHFASEAECSQSGRNARPPCRGGRKRTGDARPQRLSWHQAFRGNWRQCDGGRCQRPAAAV